MHWIDKNCRSQLLMAALRTNADIIFSSCYGRPIESNRADHYIFMLWFVLSSIFFSSPNLSRRRLDVYHTSAHGVVLV